MRQAICLLAVLLFFPVQIAAYIPPNSNNKFGIHLAQPQTEDIEKAAELVNTNGGKWGYITLVIQEDDRKTDKWQEVFNKLRELKLIPIVRLATKPEGSNWRRPSPLDAQQWVNFLNSLNWVVKDRYVILFNEPNHATEWGGSVDPVSFAQVSKIFAKKLRESNKDYVVMLGGLDASAPASAPRYADEAAYISQVIATITPEEFNTYFDAWSSHSYPNPGFAGSINDYGRGTVRTFQWELDLLKLLGVKDLPVFITETGWNGNAVSREQVAENFKIAYENIWLPDGRIVAVTPFVLNYQSEPFLQFSWVKPNNDGVYPEFETVKNMKKNEGKPAVIDKGTIAFNLPKELVAESSYHFGFTLKNTGQAIWNEKDGYTISIEGLDPSSYLSAFFSNIRPFSDHDQDFFLRTGIETGERRAKIVLSKDKTVIAVSNEWRFKIVPLPSLDIQVNTFPKMNTQGNDFEIQIFDAKEELVYKEQDMKFNSSKGKVLSVKNIALGTPYRVVLLKKYYLPVQQYIEFEKGDNQISFKNMYPLDFNADGKLAIEDLGELITHLGLFGLFLP